MAFYLLETPGLLSSYGLTRELSGRRLGAAHGDSAHEDSAHGDSAHRDSALLDLALAPLLFPPRFLADSKKQPLSGAGWSSVWLEFARRFPAGTQQVKPLPGRTSLSGHYSWNQHDSRQE